MLCIPLVPYNNITEVLWFTSLQICICDIYLVCFLLLRTPCEGSGSGVPPHASFQPLPGAGPQAGAQAVDSAPNGGLPQGSTNTTPASAPIQTLPAQADPVRQLLQDELFRLVQVDINMRGKYINVCM